MKEWLASILKQYIVNNFTGQNSWESECCSASHEIPCLSWNTKFQYGRNPPPDPTLGKDPVHTLISYFLPTFLKQIGLGDLHPLCLRISYQILNAWTNKITGFSDFVHRPDSN
jgi:hypothetical protein